MGVGVQVAKVATLYQVMSIRLASYEFLVLVKDVEHLAIRRRRVYYILSLMLMLLLIFKEPQATNEEIPMLDIVHLVHNSSNTLIDNLEPNSRLFSTHQAHETPRKSLLTTASEYLRQGEEFKREEAVWLWIPEAKRKVWRRTPTPWFNHLRSDRLQGNPDGLVPLLGCMDPSLGPDQSGLGRLFCDSLDRGIEADRGKTKEP
ncbi:hypothetical protein Bca52824_059454 [Brassica carinata]|uniref:Uncharacterized protein n=1 Tax=Brassica carinata TaxID=52824 RepID=A0A8X7UFP6_BRACI|nr:hypothetical protein Bca52824_059454 [Brassica carinata]